VTTLKNNLYTDFKLNLFSNTNLSFIYMLTNRPFTPSQGLLWLWSW